MTERIEITTPDALSEDASLAQSLRPARLSEFVGQAKVKESLDVYIQAAVGRGDALDHTLFFGPPGLGKTTLAMLMAHELGTNIKVTSGPVLEKPGDLASILTSLQERDILFIDEIHRLRPVIEEYLYPAMEDYRIEIRPQRGRASPVDLHEDRGIHPGGCHDPLWPSHRPDEEPVRRHRAPQLLPVERVAPHREPGPRPFSASRLPRKAVTRSPGGRAAPRGSRTVSCGEFEISPK